ncbi:hypothetical protein BESB_039220 [Besnoitia besnoiti]|uniref:Microneme protein MIC15 n=1 Tax=Besnoitia besnoiti TaxID=94643 RepID=A0A2A9MJV6_BESBE|nr:hypothetical protein BESB_039220 [Besnoitia besnoiti]PFH37464.1 hypothetical protein BESB_039220 [Besnoitia besnoiti]
MAGCGARRSGHGGRRSQLAPLPRLARILTFAVLLFACLGSGAAAQHSLLEGSQRARQLRSPKASRQTEAVLDPALTRSSGTANSARPGPWRGSKDSNHGPDCYALTKPPGVVHKDLCTFVCKAMWNANQRSYLECDNAAECFNEDFAVASRISQITSLPVVTTLYLSTQCSYEPRSPHIAAGQFEHFIPLKLSTLGTRGWDSTTVCPSNAIVDVVGAYVGHPDVVEGRVARTYECTYLNVTRKVQRHCRNAYKNPGVACVITREDFRELQQNYSCISYTPPTLALFINCNLGPRVVQLTAKRWMLTKAFETFRLGVGGANDAAPYSRSSPGFPRDCCVISWVWNGTECGVSSVFDHRIRAEGQVDMMRGFLMQWLPNTTCIHFSQCRLAAILGGCYCRKDMTLCSVEEAILSPEIVRASERGGVIIARGNRGFSGGLATAWLLADCHKDRVQTACRRTGTLLAGTEPETKWKNRGPDCYKPLGSVSKQLCTYACLKLWNTEGDYIRATNPYQDFLEMVQEDSLQALSELTYSGRMSIRDCTWEKRNRFDPPEQYRYDTWSTTGTLEKLCPSIGEPQLFQALIGCSDTIRSGNVSSMCNYADVTEKVRDTCGANFLNGSEGCTLDLNALLPREEACKSCKGEWGIRLWYNCSPGIDPSKVRCRVQKAIPSSNQEDSLCRCASMGDPCTMDQAEADETWKSTVEMQTSVLLADDVSYTYYTRGRFYRQSAIRGNTCQSSWLRVLCNEPPSQISLLPPLKVGPTSASASAGGRSSTRCTSKAAGGFFRAAHRMGWLANCKKAFSVESDATSVDDAVCIEECQKMLQTECADSANSWLCAARSLTHCYIPNVAKTTCLVTKDVGPFVEAFKSCSCADGSMPCTTEEVAATQYEWEKIFTASDAYAVLSGQRVVGPSKAIQADYGMGTSHGCGNPRYKRVFCRGTSTVTGVVRYDETADCSKVESLYTELTSNFECRFGCGAVTKKCKTIMKQNPNLYASEFLCYQEQVSTVPGMENCSIHRKLVDPDIGIGNMEGGYVVAEQTWTQVTFKNHIDNPVVITSIPASTNAAGFVQIRNVKPTGFEVRLSNDICSVGFAYPYTIVGWLASSEGNFVVSGSESYVRVGVAVAYGNHEGVIRYFVPMQSDSPVVLLQAQSSSADDEERYIAAPIVTSATNTEANFRVASVGQIPATDAIHVGYMIFDEIPKSKCSVGCKLNGISLQTIVGQRPQTWDEERTDGVMIGGNTTVFGTFIAPITTSPTVVSRQAVAWSAGERLTPSGGVVFDWDFPVGGSERTQASTGAHEGVRSVPQAQNEGGDDFRGRTAAIQLRMNTKTRQVETPEAEDEDAAVFRVSDADGSAASRWFPVIDTVFDSNCEQRSFRRSNELPAKQSSVRLLYVRTGRSRLFVVGRRAPSKRPARRLQRADAQDGLDLRDLVSVHGGGQSSPLGADSLRRQATRGIRESHAGLPLRARTRRAQRRRAWLRRRVCLCAQERAGQLPRTCPASSHTDAKCSEECTAVTEACSVTSENMWVCFLRRFPHALKDACRVLPETAACILVNMESKEYSAMRGWDPVTMTCKCPYDVPACSKEQATFDLFNWSSSVGHRGSLCTGQTKVVKGLARGFKLTSVDLCGSLPDFSSSTWQNLPLPPYMADDVTVGDTVLRSGHHLCTQEYDYVFCPSKLITTTTTASTSKWDWPANQDCVAGEWTSWSSCSEHCYSNTGPRAIKRRTREVFLPRRGSGEDCTLLQHRLCEVDEEVPLCSKYCWRSEWGDWSDCEEKVLKFGKPPVLTRTKQRHVFMDHNGVCSAEELVAYDQSTCRGSRSGPAAPSPTPVPSLAEVGHSVARGFGEGGEAQRSTAEEETPGFSSGEEGERDPKSGGAAPEHEDVEKEESSRSPPSEGAEVADDGATFSLRSANAGTVNADDEDQTHASPRSHVHNRERALREDSFNSGSQKLYLRTKTTALIMYAAAKDRCRLASSTSNRVNCNLVGPRYSSPEDLLYCRQQCEYIVKECKKTAALRNMTQWECVIEGLGGIGRCRYKKDGAAAQAMRPPVCFLSRTRQVDKSNPLSFLATGKEYGRGSCMCASPDNVPCSAEEAAASADEWTKLLNTSVCPFGTLGAFFSSPDSKGSADSAVFFGATDLGRVHCPISQGTEPGGDQPTYTDFASPEAMNEFCEHGLPFWKNTALSVGSLDCRQAKSKAGKQKDCRAACQKLLNACIASDEAWENCVAKSMTAPDYADNCEMNIEAKLGHGMMLCKQKAVDCQYSEWYEWSECSLTCKSAGDGNDSYRIRERRLLSSAENGGVCDAERDSSNGQSVVAIGLCDWLPDCPGVSAQGDIHILMPKEEPKLSPWTPHRTTTSTRDPDTPLPGQEDTVCTIVNMADFRTSERGYDTAAESCKCPGKTTVCSRGEASNSREKWESIMESICGRNGAGQIFAQGMEEFNCGSRSFQSFSGIFSESPEEDCKSGDLAYIFCKGEGPIQNDTVMTHMTISLILGIVFGFIFIYWAVQYSLDIQKVLGITGRYVELSNMLEEVDKQDEEKGAEGEQQEGDDEFDKLEGEEDGGENQYEEGADDAEGTYGEGCEQEEADEQYNAADDGSLDDRAPDDAGELDNDAEQDGQEEPEGMYGSDEEGYTEEE